MLTYDDLAPDQIDTIHFCLDGDDTLLCADVGSGKTVIAETVISLWNDEAHSMVSRWLVLAPLLVCDEVWRDEHTNWEHLQGLTVAVATGNPDERKAAIESDAQVVVLNYENLAWLMDEYPIERRQVDGKRRKFSTLPFDGLVCDEVDKLKDVSSERFKQFRNQIEFFQARIGMTGTILPNHLLELWGQVFIVDGGQTFGRSYYKFRSEYFYPIDYNQYDWRPFPDTYETILEKLGGLAYRLKAHGLPEVVVNEPTMLTLPADIRPLYRELHKELYAIIEDEKGKAHKLDAANRAVLSGKLQQICAGFSYVDRKICTRCGGEVVLSEKGKRVCGTCDLLAKPEAVWHSYDKLDWLDTKLAELAPEPVLVFYHFKEELAELQRRYPKIRTLGSDVTKLVKRENIRAWNAGEVGEMALHPGSAGHGLNLQKGGARHVAFLTWPWSGGMFKQVVGRLARRGALVDEVLVHGAAFADTVDIDVIETVTGRLDGLETFLDDLYKWQNAAA